MIRPEPRDEHVRDRRLGHVEGARQVHLQHLVPVGRGHLRDRLVDRDARVVDEDVEPAVLLDHLLDYALAVLRVADVALVQRKRASLGLDRLAQFVGARLIRGVAGCDSRAVRGECVADRRADPPGAAGDQGDPSGEIAVARSGLSLRTCGCHCAVPFRF